MFGTYPCSAGARGRGPGAAKLCTAGSLRAHRHLRHGLDHGYRGQCHGYQPSCGRGVARRLDSIAERGVVDGPAVDGGCSAGGEWGGRRGLADRGRCAHSQASCSTDSVLRLGLRSCARQKRLWAALSLCSVEQWLADPALGFLPLAERSHPQAAQKEQAEEVGASPQAGSQSPKPHASSSHSACTTAGSQAGGPTDTPAHGQWHSLPHQERVGPRPGLAGGAGGGQSALYRVRQLVCLARESCAFSPAWA
jgi:hypothetical protein